MQIINMTNQDIPDSTQAYDGKMRDHWPASPEPPAYDTLDSDHIRWLYRILLNTGTRVLIPDFEGNATMSDGEPAYPDLYKWRRYNLETSTLSLPLYSAASSYIDHAISEYSAERNLADNFFLWGMYGFPLNGRRVALRRQSEVDYQAQNAQEQVVTDNFTALFPSLYLKRPEQLRNGVFEDTCRYTSYALNMMADGRPVMPCIMKGMMSDKDFKYYLDTIQYIIAPEAVCYWDYYGAWTSGWGIDKLQMLERLRRT